MRISSLLAFLGFILVVAGCYSPLLRPFHLFNYNLFDLNKPYGMVVLLISVIGILGIALNRKPLTKFCAFLVLLLVVLIFVAAIFKVNTTFSFIPFKGISSGLAHLIKYKWGWSLLFGGAGLAVGGAIADKRRHNFPKGTTI